MSDSQLKVSPAKLLFTSKYPFGKEFNKNEEILREEIREPLNTDKVKQIVYSEKTTRLPACFMVHMKELLSDFNYCELFYVNL